MIEVRKITIKSPDDEVEQYFIGRRMILSTNHDEHGWAGMAAVRDAISAIAKEFDITIERK